MMLIITSDSRRLLRPFFMAPDGSKPTPNKRYYDVGSWLVTQLAFSFTTAPFILLSMNESIKAWAQVYFYAVVGTGICSALLGSPAKAWLSQKVKARTSKPAITRSESTESLQGATLGVPSDPGREFDAMVDEIMDEVKKRRGSKHLPDGQELRKQVEDNLLSKMRTGKAQ